MYQEKVIIGSNDIDSSLTLRVSSLFKIIQDVIMHHTEVLNIGVSETIEKGILWVISRCQVEIERLPKYQEEIEVITYPGDTKLNMIYPRYIKINDKDGHTIIRMVSLWALIDKEKRTPITSNVIASRLEAEHYDDELSFPIKINEIPAELKEKRKIHYSDVDLNGHLNNTKYIELLSDLHSSDFYQKHHVKSIVLNYLKEIRENDEVEIYQQSKNEEEFVKVSANGTPSFFALIKYN